MANVTNERNTESHLLAGTLEMALIGVNINVHALNSIEVHSISKPSLEPFCNLKSIRTMDSPRMCDDDQALENFQKMRRYEDNRYFVTWP